MEQSTQSLLAERYGQKRTGNPKRNKIFGLAGVVGLTLGAAYFGYANYSPVKFVDFGYRVLSNTITEVDFEITKPTEATAMCEVEALNNSFAVVGYKEVSIGPSETQTTRHTVTVITTETAVTGLVSNCSLN